MYWTSEITATSLLILTVPPDLLKANSFAQPNLKTDNFAQMNMPKIPSKHVTF